MSKPERLAYLLDILIPGDADFPPPGRIDLAAAMLGHDRFGAFAEAALAGLPDGFESLAPAEAIAAVAALEEADPAGFGALLTGLYSLYYVHPAVLQAVERVSGYAARPPQPEGYRLAPFDPAVVAIPAARRPHYRDPEEQRR